MVDTEDGVVEDADDGDVGAMWAAWAFWVVAMEAESVCCGSDGVYGGGGSSCWS